MLYNKVIKHIMVEYTYKNSEVLRQKHGIKIGRIYYPSQNFISRFRAILTISSMKNVYQ